MLIVTVWTGSSEARAAKFTDGEPPMAKEPAGMSSISICVRLSRTRHGRPVARIASRTEAPVTTAGSGAASIVVYHDAAGW